MARRATKKISVKEPVPVDPKTMTPHPRNYRGHTDEQIKEIMHSIRQHGLYRNVVVARDNTILAGHGVVESAIRLKITKVPTVVMDLDPDEPAALKLLAADNFLSNLAQDDDRLLTEMLKEIQEADSLVGTGFDEMSLAALTMITRPAHEIADFDAAAEWVGMPEFRNDGQLVALTISFDDEEERTEFINKVGFKVVRQVGKNWSVRWPIREKRDDLQSLIFDG